MAHLSETLNVRIDPDLRDWLNENFPAHGDVSWVVRELLEALRDQWRNSGPVAEIVQKAIERTF